MNPTPINFPARIMAFAKQIGMLGGSTFVTGGAVRDHLLGIESKDIDLEVHGISPDTLEATIQNFPPAKEVGRQFGVWKLLPRFEEEQEVDIAIPQVDGEPAPHVGIHAAAQRRDLRINAMAYNVLTHEIIDPFKGIEDLNNRILRATDPFHFSTDVLRVFRACQFAARLNCTIAPELQALCAQLTQEERFLELSKERVWTEFTKAWRKSPQPHIAIEWMFQFGALQRYFPIYATLDTTAKNKLIASLQRGASFRTEDAGRDMGLFWSLMLLPFSPEDSAALLTQLSIERFMGFPIATAVMVVKDSTPLLQQTHSRIVQNRCAEWFALDFLCDVAYAHTPTPTIDDNRLEATHRGLMDAPLPKLLSGHEIIALGYKGAEIGHWMDRVRTEQIEERIHTKEDALHFLEMNK